MNCYFYIKPAGGLQGTLAVVKDGVAAWNQRVEQCLTKKPAGSSDTFQQGLLSIDPWSQVPMVRVTLSSAYLADELKERLGTMCEVMSEAQYNAQERKSERKLGLA